MDLLLGRRPCRCGSEKTTRKEHNRRTEQSPPHHNSPSYLNIWIRTRIDTAIFQLLSKGTTSPPKAHLPHSADGHIALPVGTLLQTASVSFLCVVIRNVGFVDTLVHNHLSNNSFYFNYLIMITVYRSSIDRRLQNKWAYWGSKSENHIRQRANLKDRPGQWAPSPRAATFTLSNTPPGRGDQSTRSRVATTLVSSPATTTRSRVHV